MLYLQNGSIGRLGRDGVGVAFIAGAGLGLGGAEGVGDALVGGVGLRNGRYTAPSDGQHTAPALAVRPRPWPFPPPSVAITAPKSGAHGRIADGGGPQSRLEVRM
jgi:hypothetical protein